MEQIICFLGGMLFAVLLPQLCGAVKRFCLRGAGRALTLLVLPAQGAGEDLERRIREQLSELEGVRGVLLVPTDGASEEEVKIAAGLTGGKRAICGRAEDILEHFKSDDKVYKILKVVLYF